MVKTDLHKNIRAQIKTSYPQIGRGDDNDVEGGIDNLTLNITGASKTANDTLAKGSKRKFASLKSQ
jgi:hypothetical protein